MASSAPKSDNDADLATSSSATGGLMPDGDVVMKAMGSAMGGGLAHRGVEGGEEKGGEAAGRREVSVDDVINGIGFGAYQR